MENAPIDQQVLASGRRWHVIDEVDLAPLLADHAAVRLMCRAAEALADRLADLPGPGERFAVADRIEASVRDHVTVTGAFLERMFGGEHLAFGGGLLTRILRDQIADGVHADDVVEALRVDVLDHGRAQMLGYMLRCLFEGCRRALDFEELAVLFLARDRLTQQARLALEHVLERS